jgi:hypothetical protein
MGRLASARIFFGSICADGITYYRHAVLIDRGQILCNLRIHG